MTTSPFDYWNTIGPGKPFAHPIDVERIRHWVPLDARVLDYGCGYGRGLQTLHAQGYRSLLGVDPAAGMIAAARERCPELAFEHLEHPPHLPRPDGFFDAALLTAVLTCAPDDDAQRGIVAELMRLLRSGGVLHIADFWLQTDARNVERYQSSRPHGAPYGTFTLPEGVTVRHHSEDWIAELTSGFLPLSLDDQLVHTMNGHVARGFHWYGRKP